MDCFSHIFNLLFYNMFPSYFLPIVPFQVYALSNPLHRQSLSQSFDKPFFRTLQAICEISRFARNDRRVGGRRGRSAAAQPPLIVFFTHALSGVIPNAVRNLLFPATRCAVIPNAVRNIILFPDCFPCAPLLILNSNERLKVRNISYHFYLVFLANRQNSSQIKKIFLHLLFISKNSVPLPPVF